MVVARARTRARRSVVFGEVFTRMVFLRYRSGTCIKLTVCASLHFAPWVPFFTRGQGLLPGGATDLIIYEVPRSSLYTQSYHLSPFKLYGSLKQLFRSLFLSIFMLTIDIVAHWDDIQLRCVDEPAPHPLVGVSTLCCSGLGIQGGTGRTGAPLRQSPLFLSAAVI